MVLFQVSVFFKSTKIVALIFFLLQLPTPSIAHFYSIASVDDINFQGYTHHDVYYFQVNGTAIDTIIISEKGVPAAIIPTATLLKDQQAYDFQGTASYSGNITTSQLNDELAQYGNSTTLAVFELTFDGNVTTLNDSIGAGTVSISFVAADGTVKDAAASLKPEEEENSWTPAGPPADHSAHLAVPSSSSTSTSQAEVVDHSIHSAEQHAQYVAAVKSGAFAVTASAVLLGAFLLFVI